jgi:hypothetical protein
MDDTLGSEFVKLTGACSTGKGGEPTQGNL